MKIVFLNTWGSEMQGSLVAYVEEQAHDTEIFCFQEATEEMKQRCANALSNYIEFSYDKYVSDYEDFSQATFIRKDIEVLSSGTLMAEDLECGIALYTQIKVAGTNVYVCNVHGKSRPDEKLDDSGRIKQSRKIIDFFKDKDNPVIIGGDFNILPDTHSIRMFEDNGYQDLIREFDIDTTRNHLVWDRFPKKIYYSDYIFLNDRIQIKSFNVPKNEVSDHLPLLLEFDV